MLVEEGWEGSRDLLELSQLPHLSCLILFLYLPFYQSMRYPVLSPNSLCSFVFTESRGVSRALALPLCHLSLCPLEFERRQARPSDASAARGGEEANDLQQKLEEVRQPPPRVRPVPSLVPRPPQTSLVKFVGNIYTLKCRYANT